MMIKILLIQQLKWSFKAIHFVNMNYTIKPLYGCYQSYDNDGNKLVYSGSEWECRFWTEELLMAPQASPKNTLKDGKVVNSGVVGGKL